MRIAGKNQFSEATKKRFGGRSDAARGRSIDGGGIDRWSRTANCVPV
jgi:hypothetical protein